MDPRVIKIKQIDARQTYAFGRALNRKLQGAERNGSTRSDSAIAVCRELYLAVFGGEHKGPVREIRLGGLPGSEWTVQDFRQRYMPTAKMFGVDLANGTQHCGSEKAMCSVWNR